MDTRDIRKEIEDVPINHPEIIKYIRGVIDEGLSTIESEAYTPPNDRGGSK